MDNKKVIYLDDAIDAVSKACQEFRGIFGRCENGLLALPSAQPDDRLAKIADLVEGTIDHFDLDDAMDLLYQIKDVLDGSDELPSAEPEIIRCKDCKHYKEWESEFTPNAVVTQCMADNFPIRKAIPDGWFCAGAERRADG